MLSIDEAIQEIRARKLTLPTEKVPLHEAYGRYLATDICADRDIPPFHRATVDGFALRSGDLLENPERAFRVAARHFAGEPVPELPPKGEALHTMTGAGVPEGLDLLFKIEDCRVVEEKGSQLIYPPSSEKEHKPGLNIEAQGANKRKGQTLLEKGTLIDPASVHALAAAGMGEVELFAKPTVAVVSTGTELVEIDESPLPWQIRDTNRAGISMGLASAPFAITPEFSAASPDDPEKLRNTLRRGLQSDILIISGGVSMGDSDFVPATLKELGAIEIFHKIQVKPGKPLWFGVRRANHPENVTGRESIIFALPGNPLATMLSVKLFIEPLIMLSLGASRLPEPIWLPLAAGRTLKGDRPHFIPARLGNRTGRTEVEILSSCGSGDIASTVGSEGMALHPVESRTLNEGELVAFYPWRSL